MILRKVILLVLIRIILVFLFCNLLKNSGDGEIINTLNSVKVCIGNGEDFLTY